jgi:anti-sigma-K factor RskA
MTDRDDAHQLSGAYALHAVDAEEAALVEAAMRESEDFRSEVVGLSDTAVALGAAATPVAPPAGLRARLLDALDSVPQDAAEAEPVVEMPVGDHRVAPRRARRRRMRPMAWLAVGAAAVVLFGGGFFAQRALLEPQREYSSIQAAADKVTRSHEIPGGGIATVSWSKSEHRTAVVLNGVTVPSGKVLQLWSMRGDVVTSAGLYAAGDNYELISGTPSAGEYLAVSVEPDGGSIRPTTTPIVAVKLSA